ncbi:MAG TPA: SCP2 sterol-binding domain-containing protein [Thermoanaerobaculia bacterium]|nr:SCP2 sterol-binding domain-containing protein [Thermoanaerobaculia bacterium]
MDALNHPSIVRFRQRQSDAPAPVSILDAGEVRLLCLEAGADDVGFVSLDRPEMASEREDVLRALPSARTLISFVVRMNRASTQSPFRSVANLEFHATGDEVNEIARRITAALEERGVRAFNAAMGFPMEMDRWPGKTWVVSHKPVAVAAGLGGIGIHRNVIHPKFGNFILLGTVVTEAEISEETPPLDYNPCLECKLCVAACPVGAIGADGSFNFSACYTHNYREFMGGFNDWVDGIAESKSALDYRKRTSDSETVSMWQSLSFGANYKAAYCMAVCPAGEDVLGPFLTDRKTYLDEVVRPLQDKEETVFVLAGSDPEAYVPRRFPHKKMKRVRSGLRTRSIPRFLQGLPLFFQKTPSDGLNATYHFTFTGEESAEVTVVIRNKTLDVQQGHQGKADLRVTADSQTWLRFLAGEANLAWALLRRKIRLSGPPRLLVAFGKCFPS